MKKWKLATCFMLPLLTVGLITPILVSCSNDSNSDKKDNWTGFDDNVVKPSDPIKEVIDPSTSGPDNNLSLAQRAYNIAKEKYTAEMLKSDVVELSKEFAKLMQEQAPSKGETFNLKKLKVSATKKSNAFFDIETYADCDLSFVDNITNNKVQANIIHKYKTQNVVFFPVLHYDQNNRNIINVSMLLTIFLPFVSDGHVLEQAPNSNDYGIYLEVEARKSTNNGVVETSKSSGWSEFSTFKNLEASLSRKYDPNHIYNSFEEADKQLRADNIKVLKMKSLPISFEIKTQPQQ